MGAIPSGVPSLDTVLGGGLPESYLVVVAGGPGTGKATLVQQIACAQAANGRRVLYVTAITEPHASLVAHLSRFSFFDQSLLGDYIKIINVFPITRQGLGAVTSTILRALKSERSPFLVFDGFRSLRDLFSDAREVRTFAYELAGTLSSIRATTLMTSEFGRDQLESAPEVLIADGLFVLSTAWNGVRQERTIDVGKMRGSRALKGPHSFTLGEDGIVIYPRVESVFATAAEALPGGRATFGLATLDEALGGGLPCGSVTLLSGPAGWGKTALALQFALAGARQGEPCLFVSDAQRAGRLGAQASGLGLAGAELIGGDLVRVLPFDATVLGPDELAWRVIGLSEAVSARRVVFDCGEVLLAVPQARRAAYLRALAGQLGRLGVTLVFTHWSENGEAPPGVAVAADSLLCGRFRWQDGQLLRALWIAKMRDSAHDPAQYDLTLDRTGVHLARGRTAAAGSATVGDAPNQVSTEADG